MICQTSVSINTGETQLSKAMIVCRGREASASGLNLPSPAKKNLHSSTEKIFLQLKAVQFSTGRPVQFSTGIYNPPMPAPTKPSKAGVPEQKFKRAYHGIQPATLLQ